MPRYICKNEDCELYNQIVARSTKLTYDKAKEEMIDSGKKCKCGNTCEALKEEGLTTNMGGGMNVCKK